mmetsp:Transcript_4330/g.10327  ORF Transcript_4330/g.10327 Transcript_4330/m.10327 type:complete len:781 (+) Transcript_4330:202-2544(+)
MMKIAPSSFHLVAVLLAVRSATAFVPNSNKLGNAPSQNLPVSTTACFASEVDVEVTSSPKFPFSDRQVRFAYDEWRLIYGKGDYDPARFKSFKANHRTLVISNLKAREKAAEDGRPMPQWMSLNEYGDYSIEEYEAMLRGEQPVANGDASASYSSSTVEIGETQVRGTQALHSDTSMNYSNGQVAEYQDAFGRTVRGTQALNEDATLESAAMNIDSNYANNIDSSRGTLIIPKDEIVDEARGTQVIVSDATSRGTQVVTSGSKRGTQVVGTGSQRGTQVVSTDAGSQRGTQVIGTNGARGTQVVASGGSQIRGTQAISSGGGSRGTQVVQTGAGGGFGTRSVGGRGTQVVGADTGSYDTQPLQSSSDFDDDEMDYDPNAGTQIIPKNEGGTQIIPKGDAGGTQIASRSESAGTQVVSENVNGSDGDEDGFSKFFRILFSDPAERSEDPEPVGKRGTMVIKRSIKAPEQKKSKSILGILFDSDKEEKKEEAKEKIKDETEEPKSSNFFDFLSSDDDSVEAETKAKATETSEERSEGGGIFTLFGGNVKSSNPRPVRTSISLQKQAPKKSAGVQIQRKTKLIPDEAEKETGMPSILSFFGGATKVDEEDTVRNPQSRPTLIVKKPKPIMNQFSNLFGGKKSEETPTANAAKTNAAAAAIASGKNPVIVQRQKEAAARAAERAKTRLAKIARREALAEANKPATKEEKPSNSSPFSFFGAIGKKAEPPTLKKWRQNRDGTISGLIYGAKSFEDGTRITTSPVPRGAKRGEVVKTGGGSEYNLM